MEVDDLWASKETKKRRLQEEDTSILSFSMEKLDQDVLENVLSWLPTSSCFRLSSVCKRWKSVVASASFKLACSQIPYRDPWFFMVDPHLNKSIIFDSAERSWKKLNHPSFLQEDSNCNSMPVAASGGLVCFRNASGNFIVCNLVTGSCCELPPLDPTLQNQPLHAIAMHTYSNYRGAYKLVLVFGEFPKLSFKVYNSNTNSWEEEVTLSTKLDDSIDSDGSDDDAVYFLSTAGNVVATNTQRSPSKQYSSILIVKDEEEIIYFLSCTGTIVVCNLTQKCFSEHPRLLPVSCEYSIDVVECRGEMLVVLLSEFWESCSLRVWRFDEDARSWHQIAAMHPAMSHEFYGKKADINCVGAGDQILVCLNSAELCSHILFDLVANEWIELPKCVIDGEAMEFMSAFSFEPRIEVSVLKTDD